MRLLASGPAEHNHKQSRETEYIGYQQETALGAV